MLSHWERQVKLRQLAKDGGYTGVQDMLNAVAMDIVVPGICINPSCDFTDEAEPEETEGFCENCQTGTVQSCLVLAGLI